MTTRGLIVLAGVLLVACVALSGSKTSGSEVTRKPDPDENSWDYWNGRMQEATERFADANAKRMLATNAGRKDEAARWAAEYDKWFSIYRDLKAKRDAVR